MARKICLLFFIVFITACTAPAPPPAQVSAPPPVQKDVRQALAELPGIQIAAGEPLRGAYPGATLFASRAVLPLPGAMELLAPLAEFLRLYPGTNWAVQVRATTDVSLDYDRSLADTRAELLQRYFARQGLDMDRFAWVVAGEEGPPLELTLKRAE